MNLLKRSVFLLLCLTLSIQHAALAAEQKEWTFLTFLNGHNNLDSYGTMNMKQMETVGSSDSVNVVVQWASSAAATTKRILVKKSTNPNTVTSPVVEDMPRVDMGDYKKLVEFVKWGVEKYPAKHYFINVWNHGGGWHRGMKNPVRNISSDDFTGHSINTKELGIAMEESAKLIGHKVDIYGSDACLMGMIEVGYEMKDAVQLFLGSQETEPGAGWPYDKFLSKWVNSPAMSAVEVSKLLDNEYVQSGISDGLTLSTVDLGKVDLLIKDMQALSQSVEKIPSMEKTLLNQEWAKVQRFYFRDYADLGHAVSLAKGLSLQSLSTEIFTKLSTALASYVVDSQTTSSYAKSTGVSIWLPDSDYTFSNYQSRYEELKFDVDTHWSKTLAWLLKN